MLLYVAYMYKTNETRDPHQEVSINQTNESKQQFHSNLKNKLQNSIRVCLSRKRREGSTTINSLLGYLPTTYGAIKVFADCSKIKSNPVMWVNLSGRVAEFSGDVGNGEVGVLGEELYMETYGYVECCVVVWCNSVCLVANVVY